MPIFNRDKRTEYHTITCDHPFMIDIGMNSFTLPEILEWWNFKDGSDKYVNRKFFPFTDSTMTLAQVIDPVPRSVDSYQFSAWRFEKYNAGNYIDYKLTTDGTADNWEYYNNNPDATGDETSQFTIDDLNLSSYTDKKFDRIERELVDIEPSLLSQGGAPVVVSNLIAMNDYYNIKGFGDTEQDKASKIFLQDLRRSKNSGYISWSGVVPLFVNVFEGGNPCITDETFVYKLYLNSKKKPAARTKSQAFPEITLAAPAIGPDGINNKGKADGESVAITDGSPDKKVGANLKTSFRSYDGKFAAGSEQIYAIVFSKTIPAATFADNMVDWAVDMDIEEHFSDAANNQHMVPGTGLVIPIDMQNSNPFQWAPNYANPKGCRSGNKEKVKIKAFNMTPTEFNEGETVILSDRYSIWFIDPLASGIASVPLQKTASQWQFTYHMTNQDFFFRFADPTAEVLAEGFTKADDQNVGIDYGNTLNPPVATAFEAEEALARKYLTARDAEKYKAKYGESVVAPAEIAEKDAGKAWAGYAQVTSWDFMGEEICGLRGDMGNALVLNNSRMDHKGIKLEEYNDYGILGRGRFTAPFFGCTFPKGFDDEAKYNSLNSSPEADSNGVVIPGEPTSSFSGKGFYPTGVTSEQNDSFFDVSRFGVKQGGTEEGIFDPLSDFNNKSSNIAPYYFFTLRNEQSVIELEPHCNMYSSEANLFHLPADIAMNGSFSAAHGGPQLNLNKVQQYITNPVMKGNWDESYNVHNNFHDFWIDSGSMQWLFNIVDPSTKQETFNPDNSCFDLKPANSNRVEFRPLRDAVFAQFDPPQADNALQSDLPYPCEDLNQQGFNNYGGALRGSIFSNIGLSEWGGNKPLWGPKTKQRLIAKDSNHDIVGVDMAGLILDRKAVQQPGHTEVYSDVGLADRIMPFKYNPWYSRGMGQTLEWSKLNEGAYFAALSTIHGSIVPNNNYGASPNNKSRGAYGVIGAVVTSEMEAGVQIKTDNYLGQPHWHLSSTFYPSWGARADLSYDSPNNTALFVKIYQAWPRDQTIFDSRFFAVHHFNDGNRLPKGKPKSSPYGGYDFNVRPWENDYSYYRELLSYTSGVYDITYNSGVQNFSDVKVQFSNDGGVQPTTGIPIVQDQSITNVDFRVPSIFKGGSVNLQLGGEGTQPDLDTFKISSLVDHDDAQERSVVYSEGVVLADVNCDYVIDGEIVKNLGNYIVEKYSNEEGYDFEQYLAKYQKYTPLVFNSLWNINPGRRGRLLPWAYKKHTIGLGKVKEGTTAKYVYNPGFINFEGVKPEDTLRTIIDEFNWNAGNIIVAESGAGYIIGNIFTVTGGTGTGAMMRVSETGVDGSVGELEWISDTQTIVGEEIVRPQVGNGYLPGDFLPGETTGIKPTTTSNLKIVPVGSTNRSFKGYFVVGYTNEEEFIDYKPQVVTQEKDAIRVSAANNKNGQTGDVSWRDTMGADIIPIGGQALVLGDGESFVASKPTETTDPITGENVSSINVSVDSEKSNPYVLKGAYPKYDMFFHFHCDVSHQWIETDGQPLALENYVDMELHPF